jgi:hypothetical protein
MGLVSALSDVNLLTKDEIHVKKRYKNDTVNSTNNDSPLIILGDYWGRTKSM